MQNFIIHGFENILWLLIGAIFLAGLMAVLSLKRQSNNFAHADLLREVYGKSSYWYRGYITVIFLITALFFVFLAGPYNEKQLETIQKNGIDIEIVFDLSDSMRADDLYPNRLEVAKSVFSDFVGGVQSDRVGLILFAGKAFQSIPLSYDYNFLAGFIDEMSAQTINPQNPNFQGTAIGDALVLASDTLTRENDGREKVIILITDGTANRGVEPQIALKLLQEKNIKTYTIGVGKQGEASLDVVVGPGFTQRVTLPGVDEETLKNIADKTGGKYFRADSKNTFQEILDRIGELEKTELEIEKIQFHVSRGDLILYLILLHLCVLVYIVFVKKIRL